MKLLYLTTWDFYNEEADGVCKKIKAHIKVFQKNGYDVDYIYVKGNALRYCKDGTDNEIARLGKIKKTPAYIKMYKYIKNEKYDWVYNRFGMFDTFYYRVLKRLHDNGARILIEIPTYPYDGERNKGFLNWCMFKWDKMYIPKAGRVVDRMIDVGNTGSIWGLPTLHIKNGIDVATIPLKESRVKRNKSLSFIGVALLQKGHGYERLIRGIKKYYEKNGEYDIKFNIVGDGPEKPFYEELVTKLGLSDKIIFYGFTTGNKLDELFNYADLGVCSLGAYKDNIFYSGELKSREYLARGIPFIIGCDLDIESELDNDMFAKFSNDSSDIDIEEVICFWEHFLKNQCSISEKMRHKAETILSYENVMKPVIDYILGE